MICKKMRPGLCGCAGKMAALGLLIQGGAVTQAFPAWDLSQLRYFGVLQRIALCFLLASLVVIYLPESRPFPAQAQLPGLFCWPTCFTPAWCALREEGFVRRKDINCRTMGHCRSGWMRRSRHPHRRWWPRCASTPFGGRSPWRTLQVRLTQPCPTVNMCISIGATLPPASDGTWDPARSIHGDGAAAAAAGLQQAAGAVAGVQRGGLGGPGRHGPAAHVPLCNVPACGAALPLP